eukprot:1159236-Pelagomonas_calceolata.AAC.5
MHEVKGEVAAWAAMPNSGACSGGLLVGVASGMAAAATAVVMVMPALQGLGVDVDHSAWGNCWLRCAVCLLAWHAACHCCAGLHECKERVFISDASEQSWCGTIGMCVRFGFMVQSMQEGGVYFMRLLSCKASLKASQGSWNSIGLKPADLPPYAHKLTTLAGGSGEQKTQRE